MGNRLNQDHDKDFNKDLSIDRGASDGATSAGATGVILAATGVHRDFTTADGILSVLKGVTLQLTRGEMAAVVGASGVGKSTLLHLLGGLDRPTKGEVVLGNHRFNDMSETNLARFRNRHVGFVFQAHYLLDDFTALENVMIPMVLAGEPKSRAAARAEQVLADVGLTDRKTHRPRELSGGEQQRVAVARALANEPDVVLADEPSGNLDTATGRKLHELLHRLNADKRTSFLIATHNRELADSCHATFELVGGRIAGGTDR
ncbi:ATP-binding cassette domain-containing protein [candidate division GN15 bacterium]|nr:ATP-binding cassette domain-containing protein [candidate division GN15 bacterium]